MTSDSRTREKCIVRRRVFPSERKRRDPSGTAEQRLGVGCRVERFQVVQSFPGSDVSHGKTEVARDLDDDAPLAVPSSFVRTSPVKPMVEWNSRAWTNPFWPVVASRTRSTLMGRAGEGLADHANDLLISSIRFVFVCRRPAVSTRRTSAPGPRRLARASKATDAESAPAPCFTMSAPIRSAQTAS